MADEKRLVDVNPIIERYSGGEHVKSTAECVYDSFFVSVLKNAPTVDAVPVEKYNELKDRFEKLLETAGILDDALRAYQKRYGDLEE